MGTSATPEPAEAEEAVPEQSPRKGPGVKSTRPEAVKVRRKSAAKR